MCEVYSNCTGKERSGEMTDAQELIQENRLLGYDTGQQFISEFGIGCAMIEAKRLSDNQTPTLQEYGFIDGFMNSVAAEMP